MREILLGGAALVVGWVAYLLWYFKWESRRTAGMAYYGLPVEGRRHLKRMLRVLSVPVRPVLTLLGAIGKSRLPMPTFDYEGLSGPPRVSNPAVFAAARQYRPADQDVFVATQMRCGTTWMQQVVYQIVTRGRGGFDAPGRQHLYAISPWIEAVNSVSLPNALVVGNPPTRIIKTHLPASHCPYGANAKYIYVARHPVSCFASVVDFTRSTLGPVLPPIDTMVSWFCSDRMYWKPWPEHVNGWWQWSQDRKNVLFVHFEDMKRQPAALVDQVAQFLGVVLTPVERDLVVSRTSFTYMKEHEEYFEMTPPTMFSVRAGEFLASGKEKRHEDVPPEVRDRILAYCRTSLEGAAYPVSRFYPDVVRSAG
jgi:hypothetical protein